MDDGSSDMILEMGVTLSRRREKEEEEHPKTGRREDGVGGASKLSLCSRSSSLVPSFVAKN